jgi:putative PIN family toxin of toxin-antitoxin system
VRAVLDPNILISALISPMGPPARVVARWLAGDFELVVSELLLREFEDAVASPKLRKRITAEEASELLDLLRRAASVAADPPGGSYRSADPNDDYLLALAEAERALIVTGDAHLLALASDLPVLTAAEFVASL